MKNLARFTCNIELGLESLVNIINNIDNKKKWKNVFVVVQSFDLIWPYIRSYNDAVWPVCKYFSPSRCNSIEEDTLMRRENEAEPVESDKDLQNYKKIKQKCCHAKANVKVILHSSVRGKNKFDKRFAVSEHLSIFLHELNNTQWHDTQATNMTAVRKQQLRKHLIIVMWICLHKICNRHSRKV